MSGLKDIITQIGAIAGFAAIVGMAVLAMLYFSQARDVRRLREWAGRAPERDAEVEQLAHQIAAQAVAEMYETMPEAEPQAEESPQQWPAPEPATELISGQPVTTEGAAVEAAEPTVADDLIAAESVVEEDGAAVEAGAEVAEAEAAEQEEAEHAVSEHEETAAAIAESAGAGEAQVSVPFEPVVAASTQQPTQEISAIDLDDEVEEESEVRPSRLAPSTPAAARAGQPTGPRRPLPPLSDYQSAVAESIGTGTYEAVAIEHERFRDEPSTKRGSRTPFYVAGVLVALFAVVLLYSQLTGGSSHKASRDTTTSAAAKQNSNSSAVRINRSGVKVVVLNGTRIEGLGGSVGQQVDQAGYSLQTVSNRNDGQDHIQSVVYYAPGNKPEAEDVARELSIKTVKPVDSGTATAGGDAPVIVLAGSDRQP